MTIGDVTSVTIFLCFKSICIYTCFSCLHFTISVLCTFNTFVCNIETHTSCSLLFVSIWYKMQLEFLYSLSVHFSFPYTEVSFAFHLSHKTCIYSLCSSLSLALGKYKYSVHFSFPCTKLAFACSSLTTILYSYQLTTRIFMCIFDWVTEGNDEEIYDLGSPLVFELYSKLSSKVLDPYRKSSTVSKVHIWKALDIFQWTLIHYCHPSGMDTYISTLMDSHSVGNRYRGGG